MGATYLHLLLLIAGVRVSAVSLGSVVIPGATFEHNSFWAGPRIARLTQGGPPPFLIATVGPVSLNDTVRSRVLCVVDGRAVLHAVGPNAAGAHTCDLSFLSFGGLHWVAAYSVPEGGVRPSLLGHPTLLLRDAPAGNGATAAAVEQLVLHSATIAAHTPPGAALGVYYTTYLSPLAQLYQNVSRVFGRSPRTMETILRNTTLRFADSIWRDGAAAASPAWRNYSATCDIMHQEPALGMYCLYRKRSNESSGPIPDCPEASRVLQAHAAELSAAGFAFVAPDATNWDDDPRIPAPAIGGSDFYQLRPAEIIAEEWVAARDAGRATPQLSVFAMVNAGGTLWRWYMSELFNNATLLAHDLIFRDRVTGRKVFIAADLGNKTDYDAISAIEANDGRNDTTVPLMWFAPNASGAWEASGRLAYFSRCISRHMETGVVDFSSDAWIDPKTPCAHRKTAASPVGSSWTVSTGLSINSVPFGAVRFNGLLLKKQWYDVLADANPTDLIFAPSWNEFGSRAYSLPGLVGANNPAFYASGAAADDPDRFVLFEDGYGSQRSRSIEPSVEDGGRFYEAFASCVRVYRLQAALGIVSDGLGCDVAGEECCTLRDDENFVHAWSLDKKSVDGGAPTDSLLTSDSTELHTLLGSGWMQVCVPTIFGRGPTGTCVDPTLPFVGTAGIDAASRGPLVLLANSSGGVAGTLPLVRCIDGATGLHAISNHMACAPLTGFHADALLGFGGAARSSLFAREVHRCRARTPPRRWYTTVNVPCLVGDDDDGVQLYAA